jgi:hypothetical protein
MDDATAATSVQDKPCCGGDVSDQPMSFVYAIGQVTYNYPSLGVEKECVQALRRIDTVGKTDQQAIYALVSQRENRYLARQLCWVMSIQGLETYLLRPRDPADFDLLVETIRPVRSTDDLDVVVGLRGPVAPPEYCNGLMLPIVMFDQVYSFTREELVRSIPRPGKKTEEEFGPAAKAVLEAVMQMADNAGATDEHRVLNYLVTRSSDIFSRVAEQFDRDFSLSGVNVYPSRLSSTRRIVDVVLAFNNRNTDFGEKYFVRVDVTEEFPFLVTKLAPYFDR